MTNNETKIAFAAITIIFFLTLIGFAYIIHDIRVISTKSEKLSVENAHRIKDIQKGRLASCRDTYQGIHKVFEPFFPKHHLSAKQKANLAKFDKTIVVLREHCPIQIQPRNERAG